jgi:hypothetical protein
MRIRQHLLNTILFMSLAAPWCASLRAQTALLTQIYPSLKVSCTAPTATVIYGAKYTNTCTITQGVGPFSFSVSSLPPGLATTKTSNSITVTGTPPVGHYEYLINFSGAGYTSAFILVGLDVVATSTSAVGRATIRCIQKGGPTIYDPPLCQACIITTAAGRICDRDDNFNPTGKTPHAPTGARVTSLFLSSAPATFNVQAYTLTVSHKDTTTVSKQIAYQQSGRNPVYATQSVPVVDFNGQLVESDGGRWSFNFSPLMINSSPFAQWGVDFLYNINWQVSSASPRLTTLNALQPALATGVSEISSVQLSSDLALATRAKLTNDASPRWKVVSTIDRASEGPPDILLQDRESGAVAVAQMADSRIVHKADLGSIPAPGLRLVAAVDLTKDGVPDLVFQDQASAAIQVWQMSGTDIVAKIQMPEVPPTNWILRAAGFDSQDGSASLLLQDDTGSIHIWTMSGLDVVGRSDVADVPAEGWILRSVADVSGDGVPDLLMEKSGRLQAWHLFDGHVLRVHDIPSDVPGATEGVTPLTDGRFLVQYEVDGSLRLSDLTGAMAGHRLVLTGPPGAPDGRH